MKRLLTFALTLLFGLGATHLFAQSSMLATLSHDGEISTFYGATALKEAVNAATSGDVINLSSGSFVAVDIDKPLTIRGAGMTLNEVTQTEPTVITGNFNIKIPDDATGRLTMEGIYHNHTMYYSNNLTNATFIKCRFKLIRAVGVARLKNATFIHCKLIDQDMNNSIDLYSESSASFVNCVVMGVYCYNRSTSNFEFQNCIVFARWNSSSDRPFSSSFRNCILLGNAGSMHSSNMAYNCIGIDTQADFFKDIPNSTNKSAVGWEVFTTTTEGWPDDNTDYILTEAAKTTYKGTDGTEVGIYGGNLPYDPTPSNPQITKFNVAAKSTADGKLSVDITVQGAE